MSLWDKINEEVLPYALMIGVDYDLFWKLTPKSLMPFIKAFKLKKEQEDFNNFTLGKYVQHAIASCLTKNIKYPTQPFLTNSSKNKEMSSEEIKERMFAKMKILNSRFKHE